MKLVASAIVILAASAAFANPTPAAKTAPAAATTAPAAHEAAAPAHDAKMAPKAAAVKGCEGKAGKELEACKAGMKKH
jgi:hypothetical protein